MCYNQQVFEIFASSKIDIELNFRIKIQQLNQYIISNLFSKCKKLSVITAVEKIRKALCILKTNVYMYILGIKNSKKC